MVNGDVDTIGHDHAMCRCARWSPMTSTQSQAENKRVENRLWLEAQAKYCSRRAWLARYLQGVVAVLLGHLG